MYAFLVHRIQSRSSPRTPCSSLTSVYTLLLYFKGVDKGKFNVLATYIKK
jgi:hypothetical protein